MEEKNKRNKYLKIRVSEAEMEAIRKKFQNSGMPTLSDFVRAMIFERYIVHLDDRELKKIEITANNIANNINQIAVRVNTTGNFYAEDINEIKRGMERIWRRLNCMESKVHSINQSSTLLPLGKPETIRLLLLMVAVLQDRLHRLNLKLFESKEVCGANSLPST